MAGPLHLQASRPRRYGMSQTRYFNPRSLLFMFGTILTFAGCASHHYGAAPKHKRGCDCPKWNAVPMKEKKNELRVYMTERNSDLANLNDGSRN